MIETVDKLLQGPKAEDVQAALDELFGDLIVRLDAQLSAALTGSTSAARDYVEYWGRLTEQLLAHAEKRAQRTPSDTAVFISWRADDSPLRSVLADASTQAPFSAFVRQFGLGAGVALDLTSRTRELLGFDALTPETAEAAEAAVLLDGAIVGLFLQTVRGELNRLDDNQLGRLLDSFQLSKTQLARLFGVSRQAIDGWFEKGVPEERQEKLHTLTVLADLLERKLKPGRLAGVARTPADAYGGLTMLQMVEGDRHRELLDIARDSFDWSSPA